MQPGNDKWRRYGANMKETMRYSTVGIELAMAILVGYLAGDWLDDLFGTRPILMLVMVGVGSTAGFMNLYRVARKIGREDSEKDNK